MIAGSLSGSASRTEISLSGQLNVVHPDVIVKRATSLRTLILGVLCTHQPQVVRGCEVLRSRPLDPTGPTFVTSAVVAITTTRFTRTYEHFPIASSGHPCNDACKLHSRTSRTKPSFTLGWRWPLKAATVLRAGMRYFSQNQAPLVREETEALLQPAVLP